MPWQYYIELERDWCVDLEKSAFHSKKCYENCYLFETFDDEININSLCEALKYNTIINNILERSNNGCDKKTNYKYLNTTQHVEKINQKNDKIKQEVLNTLNLRRINYAYKIKQSDYKRMVLLIGQEDIPGIHRLIKSCLSSNCGINGIINKLNSAIYGNYF